jgi:hypothetical protein
VAAIITVTITVAVAITIATRATISKAPHSDGCGPQDSKIVMLEVPEA